MRLIYQAQNSVDAHLILDLFQQAGLSGRVDGEYLQGGMGELQIYGVVRVMIAKDDYEQAKEIVRQWEAKEEIVLTGQKSLQTAQNYCSKIVCIARNYVEHIKELGNEIPTAPALFMKPPSAIADEIYFDEKDAIHYEGEICFIVRGGNLSDVGFGLDLTKREIQSQLKAKGLPWERAKAFDGSAVFSEFVPFDGEIKDLHLELFINNKLVQQGGCELMLYQPEEILSEIQSFCTLVDGDIIMTGTPKGVGKINRSDKFVGKIFHKDKLLVEQMWLIS